LALIIIFLQMETIITPNFFSAWAENNTIASQKQRRIALVIGNSKYQQVSELTNPVNDANDMAVALRGLGFEVILLTDARLQDMDLALAEFSLKLRGGGVGTFFYAGHGIQMNGENYLIPVDAKLKSKTDIAYEALPVGKILGRMEEADNQTNIIILDACRNNPFSRGWSRSLESGLAQITAPTGTFIAYATAPGKLAEDGEKANGTFTQYILKYIKTPKLSIESLFKQVRQEVAMQTKRQQVPWDSSSLIGEFSFNPVASIIETKKSNLPTSETVTPKPTKTIDWSTVFKTKETVTPKPTETIDWSTVFKTKESASPNLSTTISGLQSQAREKFAKKDFQGAIADYSEVIRLKPKDDNAYNNRGIARYQANDFQGALADFNVALRLNPNNTLAYRNRGNSRWIDRDYEGAIADYTVAIRLDPFNEDIYIERGYVRGNKDPRDYQGAIADYNQALRLNPRNAYAYWNRGHAKENRNAKLQDFQKAADLALQQKNISFYKHVTDYIKFVRTLQSYELQGK
jgi:Caspase domain/TPR repeat/Tetratricopeptide repeat